ncbi:hypothetical protein B0O80DRAFT_463819 [Mortierella sp. GBAus27b]|nr:hypothetical protein B0O80DRAFT_463819 [Mortierella sp. GBAus27b]
MEFPRMKELELWNFTGGDGGSVSLEFMRKCPGLVSCYWSIYPDGEHQAFPGFLRSLDAKTWPNLHRLNIQGAVEEDTFVKTIQGIERITHLTALCAYSSFAPTSMAMLRQHFVNLRGLDLKWTGNNVMFPMAQEILSSCPLLESFSSTWIDATLVASGNPWVCLGLQRLELSFSFTPSTICLVQPLVFEQLSRLKRLRHLRLWKCDDASNKKVEFQEAVDLRLENGLNKLSTLRGLQTIDWGMTKQKMGEKEVNWIIEHWKSLERIRGRLDTSVYKVDKALCLRLISCGITC